MEGRLKRGFTLIELITVIGMLVVMVGSIASAVSSARRRANIQKATTEAQEMTNAILAYENYGKIGEDSPLKKEADHFGTWQDATESDLAFILGKVPMPNGQGNVPVLFNAAIHNGKILDPWGHPYKVRIIKGTVASENNSGDNNASAAFAIPNINRIPAYEEN